MTVKTLHATQGGGTAVYDEQQKAYFFVEVPSWSDYKPGDRVPEEWSFVPAGSISIGDVEEMDTTERDGYEAGYANKSDPNPFIPGWYHDQYQAGWNRGEKERLAMDEDSEPNSDANICA